jgi:hypothetical protein
MPIPPQIFQAWLQASAGIPAPMAAAIQSWKDLNPEYTHHLFDDAGIRDLFQQHFEVKYLETYDLIVPPAFKVDFWRFSMLYKFGGVYADSKMTLLKPLKEIIRAQDDMIVGIDDVDMISNAFLAFAPGHPVLEGCVNAIIRHVADRNKTEHVLTFSGPGLFAKILTLWLGIGPKTLATGRGPHFQLIRYGHQGEHYKTHFYDATGVPFIKVQYDTYKRDDNLEWRHYPALWHMNVMFKDRLADPRLAELPYMKEVPSWLLIK